MPRGKGCDGFGATLPHLGWEGLVPWLVGTALAAVSRGASQHDLPPALGCPLAGCGSVPWECGSLEVPSRSAESLTPRGAGQLSVPVTASWWVSSGLARTKCGTFRGGGTHSPHSVLGWWASPTWGRGGCENWRCEKHMRLSAVTWEDA